MDSTSDQHAPSVQHSTIKPNAIPLKQAGNLHTHSISIQISITIMTVMKGFFSRFWVWRASKVNSSKLQESVCYQRPMHTNCFPSFTFHIFFRYNSIFTNLHIIIYIYVSCLLSLLVELNSLFACLYIYVIISTQMYICLFLLRKKKKQTTDSQLKPTTTKPILVEEVKSE